CMQHKVLLLTF
nr:immunoglobulin light chain junction region [Macaca mulatta]